MKALLKKLFSNEKGLETVEWAILAGLITAGVVAAVLAMAPAIQTRFEALQTAVGA